MFRIDRIARTALSVSRDDGTVLLGRCHVADGPVARGIGLLGTRRLEPGEGVLIRPCSAVHTLGMRYPIAVLFLDRDDRVLSFSDRVAPWRAVRHRGAAAVLEAGAGSFAALSPGDRLRLGGEGIPA